MSKTSPTNEPPLLQKHSVSGSTLYHADCFDVFPLIPDKSVQLILADLPYGTTACKWDTVLPFDKLWTEYERIITDNGAIVLTASQPFTSALVMSNTRLFKYELIFEKPNPSNPLLAKKRWLNFHENILVFYKKPPTYNPQKVIRLEKDKRNESRNNRISTPDVIGNAKIKAIDTTSNTKHSSSVLKCNRELGLHPTQKPIPLFKTLISAFSKENDMVMDNTMGSGTTCLAAKELNRKFIGIEKELKYYEIARQRCGF